MKRLILAFVIACAPLAVTAQPVKPSDPKDAQIAQLQAKVSQYGALIAALQKQRNDCHDQAALTLANRLLAPPAPKPISTK